MKNRIAFALSSLLLSATAHAAQQNPAASPALTPTPTASPLLAPLPTVSPETSPTPTDSQPPAAIPTLPSPEREELERLREEKRIRELVEKNLEDSKEVRDRVQFEVDRTFNRTKNLLDALLFVLILFPLVAAVSFWMLRRSIIYQIAAETKNILDKLKDEFGKQLEAQAVANLKRQTEVFKQEIETIKSDNIIKLTSLISEAQTVLEEIRQQKDVAISEIERMINEQQYHIEQEIEPLNNDALSQMLEMISDERPEPVAENEESEEAAQEQVFSVNDYFNQGNTHFTEGRYVEANNCYNEAVKIERNFPEARYQNARAYAMRYSVNLAIGNLQWAIDLDPKYQEMAKTDSAFDGIRTDEQFKKLIDG